MPRQLQTRSAQVDEPDGSTVVADRVAEIPHVCLIGDLCRILQVSRTTIEKLRRHGVFPIPELPALDKRPRWSGEAVRRYLASEGSRHRFGSRRRSA